MMMTRPPRTSARARLAAAVAAAALLQVTTLLGTIETAKTTAAETSPVTSGQSLFAPVAKQSPSGDGYGAPDDDRDHKGDRDDGNRDRDDRNRDRDDEGRDRSDDSGDRVDKVVPSVGQLTFEGGACSATVITSDSEQLALTAAHCVYTPEHSDDFLLAKDAKPGWAEDVKFTPGRDGDDAPYGMWQIDRMWVDQRWQDTGKRRYDIAVLRIAKEDGKTIQDVVGSQEVNFRAADQDKVVVFGYPGEKPFDGTHQRQCVADELEAKEAIYVSDCRMNGGSSGGSWMRDFDEKKGVGTIVAVTSFRDEGNNRVGGVIPGEFARDLIDAAEQRARQS